MGKRQTYYQESVGRAGLNLDRGKDIYIYIYIFFFFLKIIICLNNGELIVTQYSCLKNVY